MSNSEWELARDLWHALDGGEEALRSLEFTGPAGGLPSRFQVGALASATVGVATLAAAELWAARRGEVPAHVTIDRGLAAAAFRCERLLAPVGWSLPPPWDPIAGDYETVDGWIRLHTNYSYHRDALARVLGAADERESVAAIVKTMDGDALETAIVDAGGCAAVLRTTKAWNAHPQGRAVQAEPLIAWQEPGPRGTWRAEPQAPLAGIRVLDLTRVIAGPVGTRHLAAFGADVLRIDPPGFAEVGALLPETTRGKRCAALNLAGRSDQPAWERLIADADVLVHGYRPGAMEALGYSATRLRELNASLVIIRYDAYGWGGPWAGRRGFDSLLQMSTGIAHPGNGGRPTPLPAQALDHGTGYLIAAAACRALSGGRAGALLSLARTARLLQEMGADGDPHAPEPGDAGDYLEPSNTGWGSVRQVRCPGSIEGYAVRWRVEAGPLGRHEPRWESRN